MLLEKPPCLPTVRHVVAHFLFGLWPHAPLLPKSFNQPTILCGKKTKAVLADLKLSEELVDVPNQVHAHSGILHAMACMSSARY